MHAGSCRCRISRSTGRARHSVRAVFGLGKRSAGRGLARPTLALDTLCTIAASRIYLDNRSARWAICQPMPPIARLPFPVRNGDDEDVVGFDGVEHRVRKHAHEAAPDIFFQHPPAVRRGDNLPNGGLDLAREAFAEIAPSLHVKANRLLELRSRFGMERVPHLASKRSMRR